MAKRQKKGRGKEHLEQIIDLCRSAEEKGIDPFLVDIDDLLAIIHEYFPEWENPEELCLDAEAVHQVASAINLQSEWVKHRSTSLYTDPFLIKEKLRTLSNEEISTLFLESWHPIVELEQVSPHSLSEAIKYWQSLTPLAERWQQSEGLQNETETVTREELLKQQVIAEREFSKELELFWQELKREIVDGERIEYWDFIGAETYDETVRRAYLTSFLVTYGYATLKIDRLEETVHIKPCKTPTGKAGSKPAASLAISIGPEDWRDWKEHNKN